MIARIKRRIDRICLKPIQVFCFHQVSDTFEPDTMKECDWMQIDAFKRVVTALRKESTFISLPEVKLHLEHDHIRLKKYVALTADDGCASLKNILPWLAEQEIPVTLFLNPCYLDGRHFRSRDSENYLTLEEINRFSASCNTLSVALHGWEHKDVSVYSESDFRDDIEKSLLALKELSCVVPFYAYPWGKHGLMNDAVLREVGMTPVLMDGAINCADPKVIHRELLTK